ncbi:hypothetical protein HK405_014138, partial [Cladochytrium tenue]
MITGTTNGTWYTYEIIPAVGQSLQGEGSLEVSPARFSLRRTVLLAASPTASAAPTAEPLGSAVLSSGGAIVTRQPASFYSGGGQDENYIVLLSAHRACVLLACPGRPPAEVAATPLHGAAAAGVASVRGLPSAVATWPDGSVRAFDLPGLEPVDPAAVAGRDGGAAQRAQGRLAGIGRAALRHARILEDGRVACWWADRDIRILPGISERERFPRDTEPAIYDVARQSAFARAHGRQGVPARTALRNPKLDEL